MRVMQHFGGKGHANSDLCWPFDRGDADTAKYWSAVLHNVTKLGFTYQDFQAEFFHALHKSRKAVRCFTFTKFTYVHLVHLVQVVQFNRWFNDASVQTLSLG